VQYEHLGNSRGTAETSNTAWELGVPYHEDNNNELCLTNPKAQPEICSDYRLGDVIS